MAIIPIGGYINNSMAVPNDSKKYGPYSASGQKSALQVAFETLDGDDVLCVGLTVGIINEDGSIDEYWFKSACSSVNDLVKKNSGSGSGFNPSYDQQRALDSGITTEKVATYDGYATGKQNALSEAQQAAVDSGITAEKVAAHDGKQNALTTAQMNAVNSGITGDKVDKYEGYESGKQNALSSAQLAAANSGVTSDRVKLYNDTYDVVSDSRYGSLDIVIDTAKQLQANSDKSKWTLVATSTDQCYGRPSQVFTLKKPIIPNVGFKESTSVYSITLLVEETANSNVFVVAPTFLKKGTNTVTVPNIPWADLEESEDDSATASTESNSNTAVIDTYVGRRFIALVTKGTQTLTAAEVPACQFWFKSNNILDLLGQDGLIEVAGQSGGGFTPTDAQTEAMNSGAKAGYENNSFVAGGDNDFALGFYSHVEGLNTKTIGEAAHAEGEGYESYVTAKQEYTITSGQTLEIEVNSVPNDLLVGAIVGENPFAYVTAINPTSKKITIKNEGNSVVTIHAYSQIFINCTTASGEASHAEGFVTKASGSYSHAEGFNSLSSSRATHAEGLGTIASGEASHAEGCITKASGKYSHSEGYGDEEGDNLASGEASHTEGWNSKASGKASHAEGESSEASTDSNKAIATASTSTDKGYACHAEGYMSYAVGAISHAEGNATLASGTNAHSEGKNTIASGKGSHAEGWNSKASGKASHAEGEMSEASTTTKTIATAFETTSKGYACHAEGYMSYAVGAISHAEGNATLASGTNAHSEGTNSTASGDISHAEGCCTKSNNIAEHAQGKYNDSHNGSTDADKTIHSVGIGSSDSARSNAHEIMVNGDNYIKKLYLGQYGNIDTPIANVQDVKSLLDVLINGLYGSYKSAAYAPMSGTYLLNSGDKWTVGSSAGSTCYIPLGMVFDCSPLDILQATGCTIFVLDSTSSSNKNANGTPAYGSVWKMVSDNSAFFPSTELYVLVAINNNSSNKTAQRYCNFLKPCGVVDAKASQAKTAADAAAIMVPVRKDKGDLELTEEQISDYGCTCSHAVVVDEDTPACIIDISEEEGDTWCDLVLCDKIARDVTVYFKGNAFQQIKYFFTYHYIGDTKLSDCTDDTKTYCMSINDDTIVITEKEVGEVYDDSDTDLLDEE